MRQAAASLAGAVLLTAWLTTRCAEPFAAGQGAGTQTEGGAGAREAPVVTSTTVEVEGTTTIALNQHRVVLLGAEGEAKAIPVVLTQSLCAYSVEFVWKGEQYERSAKAWLYELRSQEAEVPYTWAMLRHSGGQGFRLFAQGPGQNYLACVAGPSVLFVEVSKPRDRHQAVKQSWAPKDAPQFFDVPVCDVVGHRHFGVNAVKFDITILWVARGQAGKWIVEVHGTDPNKVFTLVSADGKAWRRE